jgi:epoxyqueuosine reductase
MASPAPPAAADHHQDDLLAALEQESLRLGFSRLGVASADPNRRDPSLHERFRQWLDRGYAAEMAAWLERHEPFRRDPAMLLAGVRSVIMLATDYATQAGSEGGAMPAMPGRGRVARYAQGGDYHDLIRSRLNALGDWLERRIPGCKTRGIVDSAPFAEREFGWLAGLGWFGKNTMLIDPRAGSYFFLSALLTDLELPESVPVRVDHCGTCTACLDACPTDAFVEPRVLDANRCISWLSIEHRGPVPGELRAGMGDWIFGCDICQEVCPWNRLAPGSQEPLFQARGGEPTLALAELLRMDDEAFRGAFKGTPLVRAKRSGLLRSAAIALGNRPDPASVDALVAALSDGDEIVRGAAAWALGRWIAAGEMIGPARAALESRLPQENDADVRAEIESALS